ncbi:4Fe-4S dicluster domain-containing protein [Chloroflexota bacterium]
MRCEANEGGCVGTAGVPVKRLSVREELCSGCRACEVACVAQHDLRFGTATARIRVVKIEPLGIDQPHVCRLCRPAPCLEACPTGALYRDQVTGAVLLEADECIGCSACADACPFEMAALHPEISLALICDLCGGAPVCVKRCATGAIAYADVEEEPRAEPEAQTFSACVGSGTVE